MRVRRLLLQPVSTCLQRLVLLRLTLLIVSPRPQRLACACVPTLSCVDCVQALQRAARKLLMDVARLGPYVPVEGKRQPRSTRTSKDVFYGDLEDDDDT